MCIFIHYIIFHFIQSMYTMYKYKQVIVVRGYWLLLVYYDFYFP